MFNRVMVALVMGVLLTSCINRNITYVQVPTPAQMVTEHTKEKELSPTAKIVVEGTTEIIPSTNPDPKLEKKPPAVHDEKIIIPKSYCPRYVEPKLPEMPAAPLAQLNALKPTDTAAISALTRNYINALQDWGIEEQSILSHAYQEYEAHCAAEQRRHAKM